MAFAYTTAVAGAGTVSCAGTTTVTGSGTSFAFGFGSVPTGSQARVGGTITIGANTRTITAIASATSLTVDTAFPVFVAQAFTVQTGIIQTGTDTMNLSLGSATGFLITNRGDLFRTFDCRGLDLTINGTLTISSSVAQLRNDGSCNNRLTVNGSVSGGELIFNGRIASAGNGPIPYAGLDWLGTNGMGGATALNSTNATYPAKLTVIDACIRFGGDWFTVSSGNFARITTQGEECWILCAKGTGTSQARIRLNNTTPVIDLQATQTWIGTWLNFGVPQISLKGFTPIFTDGPELNLSAVAVATRIDIENYDTRYIQAAYYPGSQIVPYGGAWIRLKNNLLGTNIVWRSLSVGGATYNVIEYSKQIKAVSKDSLGNVLNDGYFYFQPVGTNVAGVRAKGGTSNITFDLTAKTLPISGGFATTEFIYAWDYANTDGLKSTPKFFCSGQTTGAETHPGFLSRYGYDKQPITLSLSGNNTFEVTASHLSLPTSDKVIATAAAISGIAFNFTTKVMTITGNLTYQQIYDAYQYALNTTANLFQANDCLTANSTSDYVGWTINVGTGVTVSAGSGNFSTLKANTITLTGTAQITGIYQDTTGTSTVLTISGFGANSAVYVEDNSAIQKFYSASSTGTVTVYIPPTATGSWYYAVEKYGNQRQSDFFTFSGGLKSIVVKDLPDTGITVTNSATVGAYTQLETPDKIYDYVAYLRLSAPHIGYGQIVFKNGSSLDLVNAGMLVNQSAVAVASFNFTTKLLTIKSTSLGTGVTYNKVITAPPKTITASTTEVITVDIEDANGDSSVNIQGGSGNFTLWKITNATAEDDYATGTNLGNVGNVTFRFLQAPGYKIVIRDNTTGFRQVVSMTKGVYTVGLFFGAQVQLAQAPEVTQINTKVTIMQNNITAIQSQTDKMQFNAQNHIASNIHQLQAGALADIQDGIAKTTELNDAVSNINAKVSEAGGGGGGYVNLSGVTGSISNLGKLVKEESDKLKEHIDNKNNETKSHIDIAKSAINDTIESIEIPEIPETDLSSITEGIGVLKARFTTLQKWLKEEQRKEMEEKDKENEGKMGELQSKIDEMEEVFEEMQNLSQSELADKQKLIDEMEDVAKEIMEELEKEKIVNKEATEKEIKDKIISSLSE